MEGLRLFRTTDTRYITLRGKPWGYIPLDPHHCHPLYNLGLSSTIFISKIPYSTTPVSLHSVCPKVVLAARRQPLLAHAPAHAIVYTIILVADEGACSAGMEIEEAERTMPTLPPCWPCCTTPQVALPASCDPQCTPLACSPATALGQGRQCWVGTAGKAKPSCGGGGMAKPPCGGLVYGLGTGWGSVAVAGAGIDCGTAGWVIGAGETGLGRSEGEIRPCRPAPGWGNGGCGDCDGGGGCSWVTKETGAAGDSIGGIIDGAWEARIGSDWYSFATTGNLWSPLDAGMVCM
mmetsp:Transcript_8632/g.15383  ORF Transcript_8632/g.15383 Transcript_8632/m.15383 type:complete len:291 (-) Transcript_8632:692-1564(-)